MKERIESIISKIDNRISNIDLTDEYKPEERKLLSNILSNPGLSKIDPYEIVSTSNIFLSAILINEQYENINEVIELFTKYKHTIEELSHDNLRDFYCATKELQNEITDKSELIDYLNDSIKKIESKKLIFPKIDKKLGKKMSIETINLLKLFIYADEELIFITGLLKEINEIKEEIKDTINEMSDSQLYDDLNAKKTIECTTKNYIKEAYEVKKINNQLARIGNYSHDLDKKNKKYIKEKRNKLNNLTELKNILLTVEETKEITNVEKIINITPIGLKQDVLRLVADVNKKYYDLLEIEYIDTKENSLVNYINLFNELEINFDSLTDDIQQKILKIKIDKLEKIIEFINDIEIKVDNSILKIILNIELELIDNLYKFIEKGILTKSFIKNNIQILYDKEIYNKLLTNINIILENGINVIGIKDSSLDVFLGDSLLIKSNIELVNKLQINVKSRYFKNYMFLLDENLETKLIELKKLNIDLNNNLEVLNCDNNISKRIKICNILGINIYEKEKIRLDILDKDEFFIPNPKLDDYLPKYSKQKKYMKTSN